ncbi:MAG: zinc-binding dehydrogenase [Pseudomonadales bacterium]|nr:zinc-binding dehydrogenase [Pseudomonadales bacterium]
MTAIYLVPTRDGGVYEYQQVERPEPSGSQVLVQVHASGTNRGELLMIRGFRSSNPRLKAVPSGIEFAGEIVEVGDDATGWHVGERVMARGIGGYAEYAVASSSSLMRIPDSLSYAEAACVPNIFITSHDALVTNAQISKGDHVVITAASSGIGTASIKLAKLFGAARIVATTRDPAKSERLTSVGADVVINTSEPGYPDKVRTATDDHGADVIIDSVGGPMFSDNLDALAVQGRFVSVGRNGGEIGEINLDALANKRAALIGTTFRTRTPQEA